MTAISKSYFYEKITKDMQCKDIHYWQPNCLLSLLHVAKQVILGVSEFYIPIYLVQTALRYKKLNKNRLRKLLLAYLRSVLYGIFYGTFFMSSLCGFYKMFGRLHYYGIGFGPGICAGCSIFVESKEMLVLNTLLYTTLVFETIFRHLEVVGRSSKTVFQETTFFMICSSLLMYLMSNRKTEITNFWFYTPPKINQGLQNPNRLHEPCIHKNSCQRHCLDGVVRYFLIGYAINFAKLVIRNFKRPNKLWHLILSKDNFLFAAFFGLYVGIFNTITCLLSNKQKKKKSWHMVLAGFLSGISYAIQPNLQMIAISVTTIFQDIREGVLERFRMREILFILSTGILTHILLANKNLCPKYYVNTANSCSRGILLRVYYRILNTVMA